MDPIQSNQSNTGLVWRDASGRDYTFRLTLGDARRLKDKGVDLLDPDAMQHLFVDSLKVVETISELLRPQWEQRGLTYEQFAESLIDEASSYLKACEAFSAGLADFFRRLGRNALAAVVVRAWAAIVSTEDAMVARVAGPGVDKLLAMAVTKAQNEFDRAIEKGLEQISGPESGS